MPELVADLIDQPLLASELALEDFVMAASHDLTEPLRMVTTCLGLLERRHADQLDPGAVELIGHALHSAARMGALLEDLLRYARAGAEPVRVAVDVGEVLAEVLRSLQPVLEEAGARVTVAGVLPRLDGDPVGLGQVLQNLVANAAKFRAPGRAPRIRVGAARAADGEAWELWVADDGIGIVAADQERIFAALQRLHGREHYAGSGIGLAICRRVVERMGGTISVASVPGRGARFTVRLPG